MRAIFMGKNKQSSVNALRYLFEKGIEVVLVIALPLAEESFTGRALQDVAEEYSVPIASGEDLDNYIVHGKQAPGLDGVMEGVDIVISFLYWKKIIRPLIDSARLGCINMHPAPLPDFRGLGGYNIAILEGLDTWGVTAHFVDDEFDTGDIIRVDRFNIDPEKETALSLEAKSQEALLNTFKEVINLLCKGEDLPRKSQGKGRYISKNYYESLKKIQPEDNNEVINRKIRAFWFPPYKGAYVDIAGEEFTLVNDQILKECTRK